jgi:hypothetical protein
VNLGSRIISGSPLYREFVSRGCPVNELSGLPTCRVCGGGYAIVSPDRTGPRISALPIALRRTDAADGIRPRSANDARSRSSRLRTAMKSLRVSVP